MKGQKHVAELDLKDQKRRDDNYIAINNVIDSLEKMDLFPSLVWVWCWDMIRNWYENEQWQDVHEDSFTDECFAKGLELKTIWDKFYEDSDETQFSLEYGVEELDDSLRDWLRENNFLVSLEDDGWVDE
jgi:hypothetical protein